MQNQTSASTQEASPNRWLNHRARSNNWYEFTTEQQAKDRATEHPGYYDVIALPVCVNHPYEGPNA